MTISDSFTFLHRYIRHPKKVGAIAPSSKYLAREMVRGLEVGPDQCIVEFGPGTGPFTEAIREILPDPANYIGIERDPKFVAILRERFPELKFIEGSAEHADQYHAEAGLGPVRAILCGLPFASWPTDVQDRVITAMDNLLQPGAEFRTFTYAICHFMKQAIRYRQRMTELLGPMGRSPLVYRNIPPAYVISWRKERKTETADERG